MSDGFITPPIHDGMACFDAGDGMWRLVRNHELGEGNDIPAGTVIGDPAPRSTGRLPVARTTIEWTPERGVPGLLHQSERHGHELRRAPHSVGDVAVVRGDRVGIKCGSQEAARLRVRG